MLRSSFPFAILLILLTGILLPAGPAIGQGAAVELTGGAQVPVGHMARDRSPGPAFGVAVRYDLPSSPWALRAELAAERLRGAPPEGGEHGDWRLGDLRARGISVAALRRLGGEGDLRSYLLVGGGAHAMQIEGVRPNPDPVIASLFAGLGIERERGPWRAFAEARGRVTLADYGSVDGAPGFQVPVSLGIGRGIPALDGLAGIPGRPQGEALLSWVPDQARYVTLPTGRGLGAGVVHLSTTGLWSVQTAEGFDDDEPVLVRPALWIGVTDWLSVHAGFWPQRIPEDLRSPIHQDGQVFGGIETTLPAGPWTLSAGAQITHPRDNEFGRTISESVFYGMAYRKTTRGGYTLGAGWRGFPSGGDRGGWTGDAFLMGGMHRGLLPNLDLVAETYLGSGFVKVRPGLRTGLAGLNVEASYGCMLAAVMGVGARCVGPNVTAAYRFDLPWARRGPAPTSPFRSSDRDRP